MADDKIIIDLDVKDSKVNKSLDGIESKVKNIAVLAAGIGTAFFGRAAIAAAAQQEQAVQNLNIALKNAGTFSQQASKGIQEFASELQRTTAFGDEVILQQVALARNFARTNEEAQNLVKAAVDLSAATGLTLDSAVRNLGKTFSGLTGELGESLPAIRTLTAEQLKAGQAVELISKLFSGTASRAVKTFSGAIAQFFNNFSDFQEALGEIVTKSPVIIQVIGGISKSFADSAQSIRDFFANEDNFQSFQQGLITIGKIINRSIITPVEIASNIIEIAFRGIQTSVQGAINVIAMSASAVVDTFAPNSELATTLRNFKEDSSLQLDEFADKTNESLNRAFSVETSNKIAAFLDNVNTSVSTVTSNLAQVAAASTGTVVDITKEYQNFVKQSLVQGVASIGAALAKGENAFQAFGKTILSIIGDMAIQIGSTLIGIGLGIDALKASLSVLSGGFAIAAGFALVALGGALKALGGGPGLGGGVPEGGGISGGGGDVSSVSEIQEDQVNKPGQQITVNVDGTVLDPTAVGLQIVDVLQQTFDTTGAEVVRA